MIAKIKDREVKLHSLRDIPEGTYVFKRNGDNEFYTSLNKPLDVNGLKSVSELKANHLYYFDGWKAFCLNFKATDIKPYTVYDLGTADAFDDLLSNEYDDIKVVIKHE